MEDPLQRASADELFELGKRYAQFGDYIRAEQYAVAALDKGAPADEVLPLLLDVCIKGSRYHAALAHAQRHLEGDPDNWRLRYVTAALLLALGESGRARAELEAVLDANPDAAKAHFALASLLWQSNQRDVAAEHLHLYLELAPEGAHAHKARSLLRTQRDPG